MKIGISHLMSEEKVKYLQDNYYDFEDLGWDIYFEEKLNNMDSIIEFDTVFLDYEQRTTVGFMSEYEAALYTNKKIVHVTNDFSPSKEYETNTMININMELAKQLKAINYKGARYKFYNLEEDKRWSYQEVQNLTYIKSLIDEHAFHPSATSILNANVGDLYTYAQYILYVKLAEIYVLDYTDVAFPFSYPPRTKVLNGREINSYSIDLGWHYSTMKNELFSKILDVINLSDWPKSVAKLLQTYEKKFFTKNDLFFYDAMLNCFEFGVNSIYIPKDYLPEVNYKNSMYYFGTRLVKIYELRDSLEDTLEICDRNTFTTKEKKLLNDISEVIELSKWKDSISSLLELSTKNRSYTKEEYLAFSGLKKIYSENVVCTFMPYNYLPKSDYLEFGKIIINNRVISIYEWEQYQSKTQQNRILLQLNVDDRNSLSEKVFFNKTLIEEIKKEKETKSILPIENYRAKIASEFQEQKIQLKNNTLVSNIEEQKKNIVPIIRDIPRIKNDDITNHNVKDYDALDSIKDVILVDKSLEEFRKIVAIDFQKQNKSLIDGYTNSEYEELDLYLEEQDIEYISDTKKAENNTSPKEKINSNVIVTPQYNKTYEKVVSEEINNPIQDNVSINKNKIEHVEWEIDIVEAIKNHDTIKNPIVTIDRDLIYDICKSNDDIYLLCNNISFNALYNLSQFIFQENNNKKVTIVIDNTKSDEFQFECYMNIKNDGYLTCSLDYQHKADAIEQGIKSGKVCIYSNIEIINGMMLGKDVLFGFQNFGNFKYDYCYTDDRQSSKNFALEHIKGIIKKGEENHELELNNYLLKHNYNPKEIFYISLLNLFKDDHLKLTRKNVEKSGLMETNLWKTLYDFQKDGVYAVIYRIEQYGGAILADDVGLGKTYQALAVAKYYNSIGKKVLVIAPKKLYDNWERELPTKKTATFKDDSLDYKVIYHTTLTSKNMPDGSEVDNFNFDAFDLIIIDEGHAFRNKSSRKHKELVNNVTNSKKVLLLTATPVNNSLKDLGVLVNICTSNNDGILYEKKIYSVDSLIKQSCRIVDSEGELPDHFYELVDSFVVTRDKTYIKAHYSADIDFPNKNVMPHFEYGNNQKRNSMEVLFSLLSELSFAAYSPSSYYSGVNKFDREAAIKKLMLILIFKRYESSYSSFENTITRMREKFKLLIDQEYRYDPDNFRLVPSKWNSKQFIDDLEKEEFEGANLDDLLEDINHKKTPLDITDELKRDVQRDYNILGKILQNTDFKTQSFHKMSELEKIVGRAKKDKQKIVIFTTYYDTALQIFEHLTYNFRDSNIGVVGGTDSRIYSAETGSTSTTKNYNNILCNFSPISKNYKVFPGEEIDILVATDVISEGQNLQDCENIVHFDLHWNPVRMIQRIGRIDRIGSKHEEINNHIFWPIADIDKYIELKEKIDRKFSAIKATGGSTFEDDAEYNSDKEQIQKIAKGQDIGNSEFVDKVQRASNHYAPYFKDFKNLELSSDKFLKVKGSKELLMQLRGIYSVVGSEDNQITAILTVNNSDIVVCKVNENGDISYSKDNALDSLAHMNSFIERDDKVNLERTDTLLFKSILSTALDQIARTYKTSISNIDFVCGIIESDKF